MINIDDSFIKEVEYQLSRSFETETLTRAKSVDFNLNIENSINNAKNTFILDPSKNELSQTKQDFLNKRLYMMQVCGLNFNILNHLIQKLNKKLKGRVE